MTDRTAFDTLAPEFRIEIDGREVPEALRADLIGVRVLEDVEATGMFSIRLNCWDGLEMKVKWIDDDLLREGKSVVVHMGYRDQMAEVFAGEISGLEPDFHTAEAPALTVRGYDRSHRLMKQKKTRSYLRMKDSDIARQIASDAQLSPKIEDSGVVLEYVLQHNQTNLEFLQQRAERIGYEVFVQAKTLCFRPRSIGGAEALVLRREVELLEFYPRSTTMNQVADLTVRGWDPKQKREFVAKSQPGDVRGRLGATSGPAAMQRSFAGARSLTARSPVSSQAEADRVAAALLNEMALQHVTGDGVCIGRPDLRAGCLVKIEGIGQRFGGLYYVTSTEHSYSRGRGYRTAFSVKRNATG
jgi:Bacteriophage probable baseplate hub protein